MNTKEEKIAELGEVLPHFVDKIFKDFELELDTKLAISEERTLMFMYRHEGRSMKEYAKKVGLTKGSFTSVADNLVAKGFIERAPVSYDRRKYALILTDKGKEIAKKVNIEHKKQVTKKISVLNDQDKEELIRALETIVSITDKLK